MSRTNLAIWSQENPDNGTGYEPAASLRDSGCLEAAIHDRPERVRPKSVGCIRGWLAVALTHKYNHALTIPTIRRLSAASFTVAHLSVISALLKSSTMEPSMATVNFSVPDDVKAEFDRAFGGQNKSAVIADLMRKAVAGAKLRKRREDIFRTLTQRRTERPPMSDTKIRASRTTGRP
jgi:hypothetical protein